ncbi:hypothetical protein [Caudoviricetes sp.]|nr:hypothetical protein [Caudoviricetes sp.]
MKLKFLAREDLLVREGGIGPVIGEAARYYGRTFDPATRGYPAVKELFEVEAESYDGVKCAKQCRKGALFAADKGTADALGVTFIETEFKDGAHVVKSPKGEKKAAS